MSSYQVVDRMVDGPNKVVMGWKRGVEKMWREHPYSLTRRRKWAEENDCPGYTTVEDNVGKVNFVILEYIAGFIWDVINVVADLADLVCFVNGSIYGGVNNVINGIVDFSILNVVNDFNVKAII